MSRWFQIINVLLFVGFLLFVSCFVYFRLRHRISEEEKMKRFQDGKDYILSQIKLYQQQQHTQSTSHLTDLPVLKPSNIHFALPMDGIKKLK